LTCAALDGSLVNASEEETAGTAFDFCNAENSDEEAGTLMVLMVVIFVNGSEFGTDADADGCSFCMFRFGGMVAIGKLVEDRR
jgi:hypothetical protein